MGMSFRTIPLAVFMCLALVAVGAAQTTTSDAQLDMSSLPWHKFEAKLGGFFSGFHSNATIGGEQLGLGLSLNIEDALGLKSSGVLFRTEASYRFGRTGKHGVGFQVLAIRRDASIELASDIDFQDTTYSAGTTVSSEFNIWIIQASYDRSLIRDDRIDLGAGLGFYVMPIKVGLDTGERESRKTDFVAPLPVLGLRSDFVIKPRLLLRQAVQVFYIKVGKFESSLLDFRMALEKEAGEHFGLGLGVNAFRLRVEADGEDYPLVDLKGNVGLNYTGVFAYLKYFM
jgi:hypothetical protein